MWVFLGPLAYSASRIKMSCLHILVYMYMEGKKSTWLDDLLLCATELAMLS